MSKRNSGLSNKIKNNIRKTKKTAKRRAIKAQMWHQEKGSNIQR